MKAVRYLRDSQRHLICEPYSIDGLHAMASELGIARCWYHRGRYPHYDIPHFMAAEIASKSELVSIRTIFCTIRAALRDLFTRAA
jgi:hypothetical protein